MERAGEPLAGKKPLLFQEGTDISVKSLSACQQSRPPPTTRGTRSAAAKRPRLEEGMADRKRKTHRTEMEQDPTEGESELRPPHSEGSPTWVPVPPTERTV